MRTVVETFGSFVRRATRHLLSENEKRRCLGATDGNGATGGLSAWSISRAVSQAALGRPANHFRATSSPGPARAVLISTRDRPPSSQLERLRASSACAFKSKRKSAALAYRLAAVCRFSACPDSPK